MPVEDGISLLVYAFEKEDEDKLFDRWVNAAQYEVSFDEFKRKLQPVTIDEKKTLEDIDKLMAVTTWRKEPIRSD